MESNWIDVNERLPVKSGYYIGWAASHNEPGLFHFNLDVGWQDRGFYKITHWIPLPEQPPIQTKQP